MSVAYLCIPSARPRAEAQACIDQWRMRGYCVAIWRDAGAEPVDCDLLLTGEYPGYAKAVNALVREVLAKDAECSWCVCAGDDTLPDSTYTADEIARQCTTHFGGTFGVMQPTGDGHGIETICGSPWMGREWCERANGGSGPLWHEYTHNFVDNELQEVSKRLGVLWQRPDLIHKHNNWMWTSRVMPHFLTEAYSQDHWQRYKAIFERRRSQGFPGSEPLAVECLV